MPMQVTNGPRFTVTVVQPKGVKRPINVKALDDRVTLTADDSVDIDSVDFKEDSGPLLETDKGISDSELVVLHEGLDPTQVTRFISAQTKYLSGGRIISPRIILLIPAKQKATELPPALREVLPCTDSLVSIVRREKFHLSVAISELLPSNGEADTIPIPIPIPIQFPL